MTKIIPQRGCNEIAKKPTCNSKPLPEGTIKDKVSFLLKQPYKRTIKDMAKIIYPNMEESSREFKSKYSYVRDIVAEMRSPMVHFHRSGRYRLVWQGQPVTLGWLIRYKKEILLGNGVQVPEWMSAKSFFNLLDIPVSRHGRKFIGDENSPCFFEITRREYITVYVHDRRGDWEEYLENELINHRWPQGLVWHIFEHLETTHTDEHMTIEGFSWPKAMKGKVIRTPYGFDISLGDGSHPNTLEMKFRSNIQSSLRNIDLKLSLIMKALGWIDNREKIS